jgi:hypothetical protein
VIVDENSKESYDEFAMVDHPMDGMISRTGTTRQSTI